MMIEIGFIFWRVYALVSIILIVNALARIIFHDDIFKDTEQDNLRIAKNLLFILVWPLAIFSPNGRRAISMRTRKI